MENRMTDRMTEGVSVNGSRVAGVPHPEPLGDGRPDGFARRVLRIMGWGPAEVSSAAARWAVNILALAGAVLIIVSAVVHLRLWAQGYSSISVIGPLFLAQGIVSILFAVVLGVFRRLWLMVAGAGLMVASVVALVLSAEIGLFGFKDSFAAPYAGMALVSEIAGAVVLLAAAVVVVAGRPRPLRPDHRVWPPAA
jgi:hypothetical protein